LERDGRASALGERTDSDLVLAMTAGTIAAASYASA
jgi:hypothetical protein